MADIRSINDRISVAPQIAPEDIAAIKAAGFVAIVNNRPDDEDSGQPSGDAIRAAAEAGRDPDLLVAQARGAGYDLAGMKPTLDALAGGA